MIDGLRYTRFDDTDRHTMMLVMYPSPLPGNPWGVLAPLRETSWGREIPVVSGEALSHAMHGYVKPLREQLGVPPLEHARRIPLRHRVCWLKQQGLCAAATQHCLPGSAKLPSCYIGPSEDEGLQLLGTAVGRAWDEGRYVFVVDGPEHVIC